MLQAGGGKYLNEASASDRENEDSRISIEIARIKEEIRVSAFEENKAIPKIYDDIVEEENFEDTGHTDSL